jgi:plasmid maintenance system antidote protein VapI
VAIHAIHLGEHLAEELKELGMSAAELARQLDVPTNRGHGNLERQAGDYG